MQRTRSSGALARHATTPHGGAMDSLAVPVPDDDSATVAAGSLTRPMLGRALSHPHRRPSPELRLSTPHTAAAASASSAAASSAALAVPSTVIASPAAVSSSCAEDIQRHLLRRSFTQGTLERPMHAAAISGSAGSGGGGGTGGNHGSGSDSHGNKHARSHTHAHVSHTVESADSLPLHPSPAASSNHNGAHAPSAHSHHHRTHHGHHGHSSLLSTASPSELQFLNSSLLQELQYYDVLTRELSTELECSLEHVSTLAREVSASNMALEEMAVGAEVARKEAARAEKAAQQRAHQSWLREQESEKQIQHLKRLLRAATAAGGVRRHSGSTSAAGGGFMPADSPLSFITGTPGSSLSRHHPNHSALATPSGVEEHRIAISPVPFIGSAVQLGHERKRSGSDLAEPSPSSAAATLAARDRRRAARRAERARLSGIPDYENTAESTTATAADATATTRKRSSLSDKPTRSAHASDVDDEDDEKLLEDESNSNSDGGGSDDAQAEEPSSSQTRREVLEREREEERMLQERFDSELQEQEQQLQHDSALGPIDLFPATPLKAATAATVPNVDGLDDTTTPAGFVPVSTFHALQDAHNALLDRCRRTEARLRDSQAHWSSYLSLVHSASSVRPARASRSAQTDLPLNAPSDAFLSSYASERLVFVTPNIARAIEKAQRNKRAQQQQAQGTSTTADGSTSTASAPSSRFSSPVRPELQPVLLSTPDGSTSVAPLSSTSAAAAAAAKAASGRISSDGSAAAKLISPSAGSAGVASPASLSAATVASINGSPAATASPFSLPHPQFSPLSSGVGGAGSAQLLALPVSALPPSSSSSAPAAGGASILHTGSSAGTHVSSLPAHLARHVNASSIRALQSSAALTAAPNSAAVAAPPMANAAAEAPQQQPQTQTRPLVQSQSDMNFGTHTQKGADVSIASTAAIPVSESPTANSNGVA